MKHQDIPGGGKGIKVLNIGELYGRKWNMKWKLGPFSVFSERCLTSSHNLVVSKIRRPQYRLQIARAYQNGTPNFWKLPPGAL